MDYFFSYECPSFSKSFKTLLVVSLTYVETTWILFCNGQLVQAALWATLVHSKAKLQCNGNKATPSFRSFVIEKVSQKCLPSGLYSQLCAYYVRGGRQPQLHQNDDNCTYYAMTKQHNYYLLYCKAQHWHYHTRTTNYITQASPNVTDRCTCDWDSLQSSSVPLGKCTSMFDSFHVLSYSLFTNRPSFTAVYSRIMTSLSTKTQG